MSKANGDKGKRSQAAKLVDLARANYRFGVSIDGKPYAYNDVAPHVAMDLYGSKFGLRPNLARDYFLANDVVPSQTALKNALNVLEGLAMRQKPVALHLRVAGNSDSVYVDIADNRNRLIQISGGTWRFVGKCPYMFRRTELTAPLIEPDPKGKLGKLWAHINVAQEDRPVIAAVLIDCLIQPNTPKPVTGLLAEHGSAKSTTAKRLVELVDGSTVELRSPPKDLEQWINSASGSWVVALDNLSYIPDWLSDAICRAATGDGNVKRKLYTDDNLAVVKFRRSVIITGIDVGGMNGDLADRLVPIELKAIECSIAETDLEDSWKLERSEIFGGLLTLAAKVHGKLPSLKQSELPRMADFGRVLASLDMLTKSNGMQRYLETKRHMMADSAMSNSFIAQIVQRGQAIESRTGSEILDFALTSLANVPGQDWPKKSRTVSTLLTKHAPALRQLGWIVENDDARNKENVKKWTLRPPA